MSGALVGISNGNTYYPARGMRNSMFYRIAIERGRFLLELDVLTIGVGVRSLPLGFFGDEWHGVYSEKVNHE